MSSFKEHIWAELGAEAALGPSDPAAGLQLQRSWPGHTHPDPVSCQRLTWWPTVFLCSLLDAFRGGLAERMLIFEDDEPFPDVVAAGMESLSS